MAHAGHELPLAARSLRRAARLVAPAAALFVVLAACGEGEPEPMSAVAPARTTTGPALSYTCGTFAFAPEDLSSGPGHDELAPTAQAATLRRYLAGPNRANRRIPASGWRLLGADARRAEFGVLNPDDSMWDVIVRADEQVWLVSAPTSCQPRLKFPKGFGRADWTLDPTLPLPGPMATHFDALVTEWSCSGGLSAADRILGPQVVRSPSVVLVTFVVRWPAIAGAGCPVNPATRVSVDLGEPLGLRTLLDGGRLPFGDPVAGR